jgi:hypothetical protein
VKRVLAAIAVRAVRCVCVGNGGGRWAGRSLESVRVHRRREREETLDFYRVVNSWFQDLIVLPPARPPDAAAQPVI